MDKDEAIRRAGGTQQALADILGLTRQAVSFWKETIPPLQVYRLKELRPAWFRNPRKPK